MEEIQKELSRIDKSDRQSTLLFWVSLLGLLLVLISGCEKDKPTVRESGGSITVCLRDDFNLLHCVEVE